MFPLCVCGYLLIYIYGLTSDGLPIYAMPSGLFKGAWHCAPQSVYI